MFFVKTRIDDSTVLTTEITDENVFTHCPDCGAEVQIDLAELAEDGELDLFGTSVCCPECSKRRWAEMEADEDEDFEEDADDEEITGAGSTITTRTVPTTKPTSAEKR